MELCLKLWSISPRPVDSQLTILAMVDVRRTTLASVSHQTPTFVYSTMRLRQRVARVHLQQLIYLYTRRRLLATGRHSRGSAVGRCPRWQGADRVGRQVRGHVTLSRCLVLLMAPAVPLLLWKSPAYQLSSVSTAASQIEQSIVCWCSLYKCCTSLLTTLVVQVERIVRSVAVCVSVCRENNISLADLEGSNPCPPVRWFNSVLQTH